VTLTVLLSTDPAFARHDAGPGHPERPTRLDAVLAGASDAGLGEALVPVEPRPARREELLRVHDEALLARIEELCRRGGGEIDPDTVVCGASWSAAVLAAGSVLDVTERLRRGEGQAAFCAVRPPGHHATPSRSMGFCLVNNVAVAAAALADAGERVLVVDWDVHHGNGTQDAFWDDGRVLFVSLHQHPLYPGTGRLSEVGEGRGHGTTINVPLPPGATGDVYAAALDEVVLPVAEVFAPTWLLVSAGFDAHRADPLAGISLSSADFGAMTRTLIRLVPAARTVCVLEGGYDLRALRDSTAAVVAALGGHHLDPEPPTSGGPGRDVVRAAVLRHR
jgi:acetoin utilization deacetylase AcuC-like enzyme